MSKKLIVIGSSNMDLIMQVDHLPHPGETVTGGQYSEMYGGKGANQAVSAVRAGTDVTFISALGDDTFGDGMIEHFSIENITTEHIIRANGASTGTALITIDANGENCIAVAPGANYYLTKKHIDDLKTEIRGCDMVLLQGELAPEVLPHIIRVCSVLNTMVVVNLAPFQVIEPEVLKLIDVLVVNEGEAEALLNRDINGADGPIQAVHTLRDLVDGEIVLTMGTKGAVFSDRSSIKSCAAYSVVAIDTTAAGDTFCGTFCAEFLRTNSMDASISFASAAAALSVQKLGAQNSVPTLRSIRAFIKSNSTS